MLGIGRPLLAGTIIGIIPILLVAFVIIEFHALNDVIAEPHTDISMRLNIARRRCCAATHGEPRYGSETGKGGRFHRVFGP